MGALGPESTHLYYKGIIGGYWERIGGQDYPNTIIDSIDQTEMYNLAAARGWARRHGGQHDSYRIQQA